jgi:transposase
MIYVGIDVAKDKHDCIILDGNGVILADSFVFTNNMDGFNLLLETINSVTNDLEKVKIGLEATGHYSYNILGFLTEKGLTTYVLNPLHTNLYRKGLSLRKTKTDKVDASTIALMIMHEHFLKSYSNISYHNENLKSLTRYRFDLVAKRAKLKVTIARLVNIMFPELESLVSVLHLKAVYALLNEYPSANQIANAHLTKLTNLLYGNSKGHFAKEFAINLREVAQRSVGSNLSANSFELRHTISQIQSLDILVKETDKEIKSVLEQVDSTIFTIPGISHTLGAMIIAEIGDMDRFDTPDKILAYAGMSPSTYQSGKLESTYAKMEKRGSKYLRYALFNAAKFVCNWDPTFGAYLAKKRAEGKHYSVAISHVAKKLVRLIFALHKSGQTYIPKD